ncbi:MAG: hypothetical protein ACRD6W_12165, partial [Nitrososphaerales archaeon]
MASAAQAGFFGRWTKGPEVPQPHLTRQLGQLGRPDADLRKPVAKLEHREHVAFDIEVSRHISPGQAELPRGRDDSAQSIWRPKNKGGRGISWARRRSVVGLDADGKIRTKDSTYEIGQLHGISPSVSTHDEERHRGVNGQFVKGSVIVTALARRAPAHC